MTIEVAGQAEQTKLNVESREERLGRLFTLEMTIQEKRSDRQKHTDAANALKNQIKTLEKDKVDLLNLINSGQGTLITVAVSNETDDSDDLGDFPSDEELAEFSDAPEDEDGEPEEGTEEEGGESESGSWTQWNLFNPGGESHIGFIDNSDTPNIGDVIALPEGLRAEHPGKTHFAILDVDFSEDWQQWYVYGELGPQSGDPESDHGDGDSSEAIENPDKNMPENIPDAEGDA